jgi:ketosteroid isomerase-like protein
MSPYAVTDEDLDRLRANYDAWNRGDHEALLDQIDPEFELHDLDVPDSPVFRGREGYLANVERIGEMFSEMQFNVTELIPLGDRILALLHIRLKGRGSGVELEQDIGHLWTMRDGKGLRLEVHLDRHRARKAAGLDA